MSKFLLRCSCIFCKQETTVQSLHQHISSHNKQKELKNCPKCGNIHDKTGTFCSRTCANSRIISSNTKQKIRNTLTTKPKFTKINTRICSCCNKIEHSKYRFQSDYCKVCNKSYYRLLCNFTFDLRKYPCEFDLSLLERYGMFNPKTNPTGVSRDHIISVHFGRTNNIDPNILSHPANCRLMLQSENSKKHVKCDMTLEDLLIKITEWDTKYKNL